MRVQAKETLWADGEMLFRVAGAGAETDRLVKVRQPFALLGRAADSDVLLEDRAVSARHVFLHLDRRGVYAVDLVTRSGTRLNGTDRMVGWLRPGDHVEVAGRRVELLRIRLNGSEFEPPACEDDLLADLGSGALAAVTLEPRGQNEAPWVLGSELVFLGWSASCGIQIKDQAVARTHCALLRTGRGAFLVDLVGRQTWVEDRPIRGAASLSDGDLLTIGSTRFTVRLGPPPRSTALVRQADSPQSVSTLLDRIDPPGDDLPSPFNLPRLALDPDLIPAEAQNALVAWMMGTIQGGQGEILRRQGEFQIAITRVLQQIQQDNATLLNAHLRRIESIDHELAALRAEIERRNAGTPARTPPDVAPLRIPRPARPSESSSASRASTTWLLQRVNQLEDENRSAWKDLLGRATPPQQQRS